MADRIAIEALKGFADRYGFGEVVVFARDPKTGGQSVATFGVSASQSRSAAKGGEAMKKYLGWPECDCGAEPLARECRNCEFFKPSRDSRSGMCHYDTTALVKSNDCLACHHFFGLNWRTTI